MENNYELVLVIDTEKYKDVLASVEKLLKLNKAEVEDKNEWGVKSLAYSISGQTNANYVIFNVKLNPAVAGKLQQQLNIEDGVLRYLMITPDKEVEVQEKEDKK
jgi:small subunit ribosomal protein S6